jgi:hypothetical protein
MLSVLLVQHALAPGITEANMRSRLPDTNGSNPSNDAGSLPYLKLTGALALRFSASPPPPPPDLTTKPAASAPPFPQASAPATTNPPHLTPAPGPTATPVPDHPATTTNPAPTITPPASAVQNPPPAILPDDTHSSTRPEDFLPFFQFPGGAGDITVSSPATPAHPPVPGQLPPSSATYQQR